MNEIKTLNGHHLADMTAREGVDRLAEEIEELKTPSESVTLTKNGTVIDFEGCVKDAKITVSGDAADGTKMVHGSKNFAPNEKTEQGGTEITYTALENGKFRLVGKATSEHWIYFWHPTLGTTRNKLLPAGNYIIHTDLETNGRGTGGFVVRSWDTESTTGGGAYLANFVDKENPAQFTLSKPTWCSFVLTWNEASPAYNGEFYVQIERGSVATDFVKHVRNEYGAAYPVTVDAFDGTNIIFDSAGTMLAATYTEGAAVGGLSVAAINKIVDERTAIDPVPYGLPILHLEGSTVGMDKDNAVTLNYVYGERKGTCTVKWQGSSSLSFAKKNYTIKFDNAFEARDGWGAQKKYCFKANYIDHSHARNICSCKLWGEIVKSRASVPTELANLVNGGAIDGFPCVIMLNGEFHGLYTWNIPKDGWMFGSPKAILCADAHVAATQFKALATLDGDFELEYVEDESNTDWVLPSLNTAIQAVIDGNMDNIAQYIDLPSAIDYYIHTVDENANDCTDKNYILVTFDGVKWYFSAYDRDSIYGLHYAAENISSPATGFTFAEYADRHKMMELIRSNMSAELKARAIELREGVKSEANVATVFSNFIGSIPSQLYDADAKAWPMLPMTSVSNLTQILNWYRLRRQILDAEIDAM